MLAESSLKTLAPDTAYDFKERIPVDQGDLLGLTAVGDAEVGITVPGTPQNQLAQFGGGDIPPGQTGTATIAWPDLRPSVAATVEPDCDKDGLGDETQDTNLSTCATIAPGTATTTCRGLPATIVGTGGNDVRTASQGQDVIAGLGGNDTLSGLAGNDVICGGPGKDTLKGGKGKDTLLGQKGKDTLKGAGGKDLCKGGKGADTASKCEVEKSI